MKSFALWLGSQIFLLLICVTFTLSDDFFGLSAIDIDGREVNFSEFEGSAILVVNVASQCGFTEGHYKGLKRLHDILSHQNKLQILGETFAENLSIFDLIDFVSISMQSVRKSGTR